MSYLQKLQQTETEILEEIDRLCEKHSIVYYLAGGTLLGAVRHRGFIPWDDDIDVAMPRNDYERFRDICLSELDERFYLHCPQTDKNYWLPFAKVRKKNTLFEEKNLVDLNVSKEIFVDIFPLDDTKKENSLIKRFRALKIKLLSSEMISRIGIKTREKVPFWVKIRKFCLRRYSIAELSKKQTALMKKENGKGYDFYVNYASNYGHIKQTMPKKIYGVPKKLFFENKEYNVPNDYEYFLTRLYGEEYMKIPPKEKQITHSPQRICFDTASANADGKKTIVTGDDTDETL